MSCATGIFHLLIEVIRVDAVCPFPHLFPGVLTSDVWRNMHPGRMDAVRFWFPGLFWPGAVLMRAFVHRASQTSALACHVECPFHSIQTPTVSQCKGLDDPALNWSAPAYQVSPICAQPNIHQLLCSGQWLAFLNLYSHCQP